MAYAKIVATGCRRDPVSLLKSKKVLELLSESNPGKRFSDFREMPEREKVSSSKGLPGLLDLLSRKKIDIVISDASDIPLRLPSEFEIGAVPKRGNPFNVLISLEDAILEEQPTDIPIGVSDVSSMAQLLYFKKDLYLVMANGGYQSLAKMMESGKIGGFVINASDVEAFGNLENVVEMFTSSICMPSAGKGAIGLITRKGDRRIRGLIEEIDHGPSHAEIDLERMFLSFLGNNEKKNVGVLVESEGDEFRIGAAITSADGLEKLSATMQGWVGEEKDLIRKMASSLLESGGRQLLERI